MTLREMLALIGWDLKVNGGWSWDSLRACLLLIEIRLEQYIYRKLYRQRTTRPLWFVFRLFGSIFQSLLCHANIPGTITIGRGLRLPHPQNIVLAGYADIGEFCTIYHNVSIAWNGFKPTRPLAPKIGDQVLLGTGCIVVGDITIGSDVLIGAGAVVTRNIPAQSRVTCQLPNIVTRPASETAATAGSRRHLADPYSIWR
jgi:serine O-acetyltransferase